MIRPLRKVLAAAGMNGRRGAFQLLFSFAFLSLGLSYVAVPSSPGRERSLAWLTDAVPLNVIGWVWIIGAAIGFVGFRRARPYDRWSFFALTIVPFAWGCLYLISIFTGHNIFGWVTSIMYWCIAVSVMVVSGMNGDSDRDERAVTTVIK